MVQPIKGCKLCYLRVELSQHNKIIFPTITNLNESRKGRQNYFRILCSKLGNLILMQTFNSYLLSSKSLRVTFKEDLTFDLNFTNILAVFASSAFRSFGTVSRSS